MANSYVKGRSFEYRVKHHFETKGWFVARQARSSFPDLIALKEGEILLIECKVNGYINPDLRRRLVQLASLKIGGRPVLAYRRGREMLLEDLRPKTDVPSL